MVIEDIIIPNTFTITINLVPNNSKNKFYNKAMDRVQYYIGEILDNSIFVSATNIKKISELPLKHKYMFFLTIPGIINCNVFVYKVQ